jgi:transcription antitermination factor NusG
MDKVYNILRVASGEDFSVAQRLGDMGIKATVVEVAETFIHRRSKARVTKQIPLLPGFVFADVSDDQWNLVKRVSDVFGCLRTQGGKGYPAKVKQSEVHQLQLDAVSHGVVDSQLSSRLVELHYAVGDIVRVETLLTPGGVDATIVEMKAGGKLAVVETLINGMRATITSLTSDLRAAA